MSENELEGFDVVEPIEVRIATHHTIALDVMLLAQGGAVLNVEKVPYRFCKDLAEVKTAVTQVIDEAFKLAMASKEEIGPIS